MIANERKPQRIRKGNPNQYRGVYNKGGCWEANIYYDKKCIYLGTYFKLIDAIESYDKKAIELFGEEAITNKSLINAGFKNIPTDKLDIIPQPTQDLCDEIWRDIPGYEGLYQASNLGRIRLMSRMNSRGFYIKEKIVKQFVSHSGYFVVNITNNRKRKRIPVHRLVAIAFIPNLKERLQVNHKDCNKLNNYVSNLEWVTHQENMTHAKLNNRFKKPIGINAKLTIEQVKEIRNIHKTKGIITGELAKMYKVSWGTIWFILKNKTWKNI